GLSVLLKRWYFGSDWRTPPFRRWARSSMKLIYAMARMSGPKRRVLMRFSNVGCSKSLPIRNWNAMAWSSFKGCMRAYLAKHELEANPIEKNAFDSLKTFSVNSFVRKRDLANGYTPLQHVLFRNRTAE